jgi:hypothetical protein
MSNVEDYYIYDSEMKESNKKNNENNKNDEKAKTNKINKANNYNNNIINNNNKPSSDFQTSNIYSRFNKIKLDIINKKHIFPIRIMIYLCFIFIISTIVFMIYNQISLEISFNNLSAFLDENLFFNMTKMTIAVLYITSINIKWQLHSCDLTSMYNMSFLYESMLI